MNVSDDARCEQSAESSKKSTKHASELTELESQRTYDRLLIIISFIIDFIVSRPTIIFSITCICSAIFCARFCTLVLIFAAAPSIGSQPTVAAGQQQQYAAELHGPATETFAPTAAANGPAATKAATAADATAAAAVAEGAGSVSAEFDVAAAADAAAVSSPTPAPVQCQYQPAQLQQSRFSPTKPVTHASANVPTDAKPQSFPERRSPTTCAEFQSFPEQPSLTNCTEFQLFAKPAEPCPSYSELFSCPKPT